MKRIILASIIVLSLLVTSCVSLEGGSPERFSLVQQQKSATQVGLLAGTVTFGAGFYFPTTSDILDVAMLKTDSSTGLVSEISHMRYRNFQKFPVQFSVRYDLSDVSDDDVCSLLLTLSVDGEVKAQGLSYLQYSDGKFQDASVTLLSL